MIVENRGVTRWEEKIRYSKRPVVLYTVWKIEAVTAMLFWLLFLFISCNTQDVEPTPPGEITLMWAALLAIAMAVTAAVFYIAAAVCSGRKFQLCEMTEKGLISTMQVRAKGSVAPDKKKSTILDFENIKKLKAYKKSGIIELAGMGSKGPAAAEIGEFLGADVIRPEAPEIPVRGETVPDFVEPVLEASEITRGGIPETEEPAEITRGGVPQPEEPAVDPAEIRLGAESSPRGMFRREAELAVQRYEKAAEGRGLKRVRCRLYINGADFDEVLRMIIQKLPKSAAIKSK